MTLVAFDSEIPADPARPDPGAPAGDLRGFGTLTGQPLPYQQPEPLSLPELRRIAAVSPIVAKMLAAPMCDKCGHGSATSFHHERCVATRRPAQAQSPVRQPWQPRPSRRAA